MDIKKFVKEQQEVLLSLDRKRILAYCKKWDIKVPEDETAFWAGVHKTILQMNAATLDQKWNSFEWLIKHGFSPSIE